MNNKEKKKSHKPDKTITKEMTFGEAILLNKNAAKILAEQQMFCGCCPMAMMETIEQGARAHGKDIKELIKELNKK
jgi:hybrid cluster-associated redox disulfide protein